MRISTRLRIGGAIVVVVTIMSASLVVLYSNQVAQKTEEHNLAMEMNTAVSQLNMLAHEYLLHYEKRMEQQWRSRYESAMAILREAANEHVEWTDRMYADFADLNDLFLKVAANRKEIQKLVRQGASQQEIDAAAFVGERVVAQLLIVSQSMVVDISQFAERSYTDTVRAQETLRTLDLASMIVLAVVVVATSLLVARSISVPLGKLATYSRRIGEGDYAAKAEIEGEDEIGDVASTVETMVARLLSTQEELRQEIADHEKTEADLARSKMEWESTFDAMSDWVCLLDMEYRILRTNRVAEGFVGIPATEIVGQVCCEVVHGSEKPIPECPMQKTLHTHRRESMELQMPGGDRWLMLAVDPVMDEEGNLVGVVHIARDITERKRSEEERERVEEELRQAQKMEAIGRLAGGIAHDFNNILTVITGYAQLAMSDLEPNSPLHKDLQTISDAAGRSTELTRQLLAFSRKQIVEPKVINLNAAVAGQKKMLGRLIGEDIEIKFVPADDVWNIRIDPSQIDQIMTNLAVNARDAIAGVGTMTIETANVTLDDTFSGLAVDVPPGDYVMLAVSDTGAGMDADTLGHVFEPFFTTKSVGEGTGLGLSTVYGIVKQNEGTIHVYSEPGMGTTFKIYLPRFRGEAEKLAEEVTEQSLTGTETVLIVEDEEQITSLAKRILERAGYVVLTATAPGDACVLVEQYEGDIDLLLTDVVMPTMNGKELQARIKEMKPGIKTLFMSGYTANIIAQRGVIGQGVDFIQKPFSMMSLAKKVREVLDS